MTQFCCPKWPKWEDEEGWEILRGGASLLHFIMEVMEERLSARIDICGLLIVDSHGGLLWTDYQCDKDDIHFRMNNAVL